MSAPAETCLALPAALVCVAGLLASGCSGSPPAPSPLPITSAEVPSRTISGTVTDVISGSPFGGVTVDVEDSGSVATDQAGRFAIDSQAPNGIYRLTITGPAVVTRQTKMALPSAPVALTLIPATFDTFAFDGFARGLYDGGMIRWTSAPSLVVEMSVVVVPGNLNNATAEQITTAEADRVTARLTQTLPLLTGSTYSAFSSITRQTTPAGQPIRMYSQGAITVVYFKEADGICGRGGPAVDINSQVFAGAMWLKLGCASVPWNTTTMVHELGHALGYGHVSTTPSVMRPTGGIDVTPFDLAAASIVFSRPPGNRAPDMDPDNVRVNSTYSRSAGGGVKILTPLP